MRWAVLSFVAVGCVSPSFDEGYACGPQGQCPPGQRCGSDGRCARDPLGPSADAMIADSGGSPDGTPDPVDAGMGAIDVVPGCATFTCSGDPRGFLTCAAELAWQDAEDACVAWGGHLASIPDESVNGCIRAQLGDASWIVFWQDGAATTPVNNWHWLDGAPEIFQRWSNMQPDDADMDETDHREQCALIESAGSGNWRDEPCDTSAPYVCARTP